MKYFFLFRWFKNVSIAKKLYFTVGIMALLIGVELFALFFSLNTLSSVRAYVGGEGLWSKAQKDAVFHLYKYGISRNDEDYRLFHEFMKVPVGDGKTRKELHKTKPDMTVARQGFLEGRNHPDDIEGMIDLFRSFSNVSYIARAIAIWGEAEPIAMQLIPIAEELRREITSPAPSQAEINRLLTAIGPINRKLTALEDDFSYTLGEASRWLEGVVLKLLLITAITVEATRSPARHIGEQEHTKRSRRDHQGREFFRQGDLQQPGQGVFGRRNRVGRQFIQPDVGGAGTRDRRTRTGRGRTASSLCRAGSPRQQYAARCH
jgi:hypothetical protein